MKKRIRLTESQLHKLIEQTINEISWQTAMNAALKRQVQAANAYKDSISKGEGSAEDQKADRLNKSANNLHQMALDKMAKQYGGTWYGDMPVQRYGDTWEKFQNAPFEMDKTCQRGLARNYPAMGDMRQTSYGYGNERGKGYNVIDDVSDFFSGKSQYDRDQGKWVTKESIAHRITESVLRKLNEWYFPTHDCICFDNAEDAFKFVKDNMGQNEDLFLNNEYLDFGWDKISADPRDIKEFLQSPYGEGYSEEQCNNLEKNDNTLLAFIEWLKNLQGFLACIIDDDVNGDVGEKYNL